jgi:DNA-3-methyladenine glycosylase II
MTVAEKHLSSVCDVMAGLVVRHGPCLLPTITFRPFETLAGSIISQQLSVKAADTIERRVLAAIGGVMAPEAILSVEAEALRACGLSNAKVRYVRALAERVRDGEIDFAGLAEEQDNETVIRSLVALPGIGRWTAEMFLIFGLKRPDVLALGDVGLQRSARMLYGGNRSLEELGTLWAPFRSYASWYLWRHLDVVPVVVDS